MAHPKAFISYSWSGPTHEAWVMQFAEDLVDKGVDVIFDKWNLREGHDAFAFMESMVADADIKKVILVCDKKYVEKSNSRTGGAGTEAQIITPELYAKKAQDKFVAVVREVDASDEPYVPTYYRGRIYIDLTDPSRYSEEFERLVRWVWDKPLNVRPPLGAEPSFASETDDSPKLSTAVPLRRAIDAIKSGREQALQLTKEYLHYVVEELEKFRIDPDKSEFDDHVVASIEAFTPYRNELIQLFSTAAAYRHDEAMAETLHRFFEATIPYLDKPEHINTWKDRDFDNFKFIIHELFLHCIAVLLRHERFTTVAHLLNNEYYVGDIQHRREPMVSYLELRNYLKSIEYRNTRKQLRRLSLRADMLKERCKGTGVEFRHLMAADFVLYLRSRSMNGMWWPETLVYIRDFGVSFELFARAKSLAYFEKMKVVLGVKNKGEFDALIHKIESESERIPKWEYSSINPRALAQFEKVATVP